MREGREGREGRGYMDWEVGSNNKMKKGLLGKWSEEVGKGKMSKE